MINSALCFHSVMHMLIGTSSLTVLKFGFLKSFNKTHKFRKTLLQTLSFSKRYDVDCFALRVGEINTKIDILTPISSNLPHFCS